MMNEFIGFLGNTGTGSAIGAIFQVLSIFALFILILAGAYYTSRYVGKAQLKHMRNSNLRVVEVITVGPGKAIQLIQVGDEYVLIGVTKDHITFMKKVSKDQLNLEGLNDEPSSVVPFSKYMEKVLKKKNNGSGPKE